MTRQTILVASVSPSLSAVPYDGCIERPLKHGGHMRTVLTIDESLLAEARRLTGLKEATDVMREALTALIERESARRLAKLGGSEPQLQEIPRRRSETA